jgi:nucleotide-binding universal stress UspA family protein
MSLSSGKEKSQKAAKEWIDGPILVPVDFSDDSVAAVAWACKQAQVMDADVLIYHVVHDPGEAPGFYKRESDDIVRPMHEVADKMMNKFVKKVLGDICPKSVAKRVTTTVDQGLPVSRILKTAKKSNARMIVIGSKGHSKLHNLLLGSKAEQVIQLADIPVVVVKV